MSDDFLRIIPTDPRWTPDHAASSLALEVLRELAPTAETCVGQTYDAVTFVDQGSNFDELRCPRCGSSLPLDWFGGQMGRPSFDDLSAMTPCCQSAVSLNDLDYRWPAGFATFVLEAMNPNRTQLTQPERRRIEDALGHEVREIWTHY